MEKTWTIWFTGLHGSGKSTIAEKISEILRDKNIPVVVLDGDEFRKKISPDLGYSVEDRNTHMKRVAQASKEINDDGKLCIACVASPTEESRQYAKKILKNMMLVYVKCTLETCKKRDVKGHYKKAQAKEKGFENFVGVSLDFEEPKDADMILDTDKESVKDSVNKLLNYLKEEEIIK